MTCYMARCTPVAPYSLHPVAPPPLNHETPWSRPLLHATAVALHVALHRGGPIRTPVTTAATGGKEKKGPGR